jgi:hypothetical protein
MEDILTDYLNNQIAATSLKIRYHIGNQFSGETEFHIWGDGKYTLWSTVLKGRERRDYSGQLDEADLRDLVRAMLSVQLWKIKHITTERGRDNREACIDVTADEKTYSVVLWVSEIDDVPQFDKIQEQILTLIRKASQAEVLEMGR